MKKIILATVLTLVMLSPGMAADVRDYPGTLLAASKKNEQKEPPVLIIKGQGGKVTGVEKGDKDESEKKKKK